MGSLANTKNQIALVLIPTPSQNDSITGGLLVNTYHHVTERKSSSQEMNEEIFIPNLFQIPSEKVQLSIKFKDNNNFEILGSNYSIIYDSNLDEYNWQNGELEIFN